MSAKETLIKSSIIVTLIRLIVINRITSVLKSSTNFWNIRICFLVVRSFFSQERLDTNLLQSFCTLPAAPSQPLSSDAQPH